MINFLVWKNLPETQYILSELQEEIDTIGTQLIDGTLKNADNEFKLIKEYYYNLGYFKGLNCLKDLIKENKEEEKDDEELT